MYDPEININSWHDSDADNILSVRDMSYIKPLNGSIGKYRYNVHHH